MKYIQTPDGYVGFPDDMPETDITRVLNEQYQPKKQESEIGPIMAGVRGLGSSLDYAGAAVAQAAGAPETAQRYLAAAKATDEETARRYKPQVPSFTDIPGEGVFDTIGRAGRYAYERAGESLAQTGTALGAGALAMAAAPAAVPVGLAGLAGASLAGLPAFVGQNIKEQLDEGKTIQDASLLTATLGGAAQAPLDALVGKVFPGVGKAVAGGLVMRAVKKGIEGGLIEAGTEGLQEAIQIGQANPQKLFEMPREVQMRLAEAAVAGMTVGGTIGGVSGAIQKRTTPAQEPKPPISSPTADERFGWPMDIDGVIPPETPYGPLATDTPQAFGLGEPPEPNPTYGRTWTRINDPLAPYNPVTPTGDRGDSPVYPPFWKGEETPVNPTGLHMMERQGNVIAANTGQQVYDEIYQTLKAEGQSDKLANANATMMRTRYETLAKQFHDAGYPIDAYSAWKMSNARIQSGTKTAPAGGVAGTFFQNGPQAEHFSNLQRAVQKIPMNQGSGQQWLNALKKMGVKDEELEWTGVNDILKNNDLEAESYNRWWQGVKAEAKKSGYALPTYAPPSVHKGMLSRLNSLVYPIAKFENTPQTQASYAEWTLGNFGQNPNSKYREVVLSAEAMPEKTYESGHWKQVPNPIAHYRTTDRRVADGNALFVDEIQSDWHQTGAKRGYRQQGELREAREDVPVARDALRRALVETFGVTDVATRWFQTLSSLAEDPRMPASPQALELFDRYPNLRVPTTSLVHAHERVKKVENKPRPGPFSQTWPNLAFRHALFDAINQGKDYIAWTTGEQQNNIYGGPNPERLAGMQKFYDDRLVRYANKLGKPFGTKVEMVPLAMNEAQHYAQYLGASLNGKNDVWAMKITPKMRDYFISNGHPLFQRGKSPKGNISLTPDGAVIRLFKTSDESTFMHEAAHLFLDEMLRYAKHVAEIAHDLNAIREWVGNKDEPFTREQHEQFARGMEQWLRTGRAPTKSLVDVFKQFALWLRKIYNKAEELKVEVPPRIAKVYENLFNQHETVLGPQDVKRGVIGVPRRTEATTLMQGPLGKAADQAVEREVETRLKALRREIGLKDLDVKIFPSLNRLSRRHSWRAFMTSDGTIVAAWPAKDLTHAEFGDYHRRAGGNRTPILSALADSTANSVVLVPAGTGEWRVGNENFMGTMDGRSVPKNEYLQRYARGIKSAEYVFGQGGVSIDNTYNQDAPDYDRDPRVNAADFQKRLSSKYGSKISTSDSGRGGGHYLNLSFVNENGVHRPLHFQVRFADHGISNASTRDIAERTSIRSRADIDKEVDRVMKLLRIASEGLRVHPSISVDPISRNTIDDVMKLLDYHVSPSGKQAPKVNLSRIDTTTQVESRATGTYNRNLAMRDQFPFTNISEWKVVRDPRTKLFEQTPMGDETSVYNTFQKAAKRVKAFFDPFSEIPDAPEYRHLRNLMSGGIHAAEQSATKAQKLFAKLSLPEKEAVNTYFETKGAAPTTIPESVRSETVALKNYINGPLKSELIKANLLPDFVANSNDDSYLPRLYLKYMLDMEGFRGSGARLARSYSRKREEQTPEGLLAMGEIKDPGIRSFVALFRTQRDLAVKEFLDRVVKNNDWVLPRSLTDWNGHKVTPYWLRSEANAIVVDRAPHEPNPERQKAMLEIADRMRKQADQAMIDAEREPFDEKEYKKLPDSRDFGPLRGMVVRRQIADDIIGTYNFVDPDNTIDKWFGDRNSALTKLTSVWKTLKVPMNPPSQVRNVVSNMILLNLSGVPIHMVVPRMVQAARDMAKNGPYYRMAKEHGVTRGTMTEQELFGVVDELRKMKAKDEPGFLGMRKIYNAALKAGVFAGHVHQKIEEWGKVAKMIDVIEGDGKTPEVAAREANKWLFDYSEAHPSIKRLRQMPLGMPFVTFQYKVVPLLYDVMRNHPTRLLPYIALAYTIPALVAASNDIDSDDYEKLRKSLSAALRRKNSMYLLPWKDDAGRWQFVDIGYFLPWQMPWDMAKYLSEGAYKVGTGKAREGFKDFGEAFHASTLLSNPVINITSAISTGTDPFTDRPIANKSDPPRKQVADIVSYLWSLAMPSLLASYGAVGKLMEREGGTGMNRYGEPNATYGQIGARAGGININAVIPEAQRARNIQLMQREIQDTKSRMTLTLKDRSLTPEQRRDVVSRFQDDIKDKARELQEYVRESQMSPRLRAATAAP